MSVLPIFVIFLLGLVSCHIGDFPSWVTPRQTTRATIPTSSSSTTPTGSRESTFVVEEDARPVIEVEDSTKSKSRSEEVELTTHFAVTTTRRMSSASVQSSVEEKEATNQAGSASATAPEVDGAAAPSTVVLPAPDATSQGTATPSWAPTGVFMTTFGASLPSITEISNILENTGTKFNQLRQVIWKYHQV